MTTKTALVVGRIRREHEAKKDAEIAALRAEVEAERGIADRWKAAFNGAKAEAERLRADNAELCRRLDAADALMEHAQDVLEGHPSRLSDPTDGSL